MPRAGIVSVSRFPDSRSSQAQGRGFDPHRRLQMSFAPRDGRLDSQR